MRLARRAALAGGGGCRRDRPGRGVRSVRSWFGPTAPGRLPPLLIELGLDGADETAGAFGADPAGAVAVARLDDVGAPGQRRVAVALGVGRPAAETAHRVHTA